MGWIASSHFLFLYIIKYRGLTIYMANYDGKFGINDPKGDIESLEDIFLRSDEPILDNIGEVLDMPILHIDMDEISGEAKRQAETITRKLSEYFLDPKYIEKHPYIMPKIAQTMDSVRRLLKMLAVNEKAQDALIMSISSNSSKGTLFSSLTSLQNAMLSIQSQLNNLIASLEQIFIEMQANCEQTFEEKDKEIADDGSISTVGARSFIEQVNRMIEAKKNEENIIENN